MVAVKLCKYLLAGIAFSFMSISWAVTQHNTVENYLQAAKAAGKKPNHLISESSPYLLQHAYNPVNWYPWGEQAFSQAKKENKPIFLSIGYSTCHWCHVMAHESFENKEIAELLNRNFISVKVDREERPDIDAVYMSATQLVNGYGGWPMTIAMNHDLEPFFTGTYFPAENVGGHKGLKELLVEINRLWNEERSRVEGVAQNIAAQIKIMADESRSGGALKKDIHHIAMQQINNAYDEDFGGFSAAPKFPRPGIFAFLLKQAKLKNKDGKKSSQMLNKTMTAMAQGGIYDQVGGGFHRYSVDARWQVPHFEKMLYSQALLVQIYARLYEIKSKPLYKRVVQETLDFVIREMTSPQGGFYSALDADSERPDVKGERAEGAFYLWSEKELKSLLKEDEFKLVSKYYSVIRGGNIYSDPQGEFNNLNILYLSEEYSDILLTKKQQQLLESAKNKLLDKRKHRPRPHLDDKIITAWNGMMITAFVDAFEVFGDKAYLQAATKAADFINDVLIDKKTFSLFRRARGSSAGIEAGLDDYTWTIRGFIKLYQATDEKRWLQSAIDLSHRQNELFLDEKNGGYFGVSARDSTLLFRSKSIYDGALPAANAVAIANLDDLARHTNDKQWEKYRDMSYSIFSATINIDPAATAMALSVGRVSP
jgi:uncharacterized protein YyaL (SSP411 family)